MNKKLEKHEKQYIHIHKAFTISSLIFILMAYIGYVLLKVILDLNYNFPQIIGISFVLFVTIWLMGTFLIPVTYYYRELDKEEK